MKKSILFILFIIVFSSCSESVVVDNPKKATTIELLEKLESSDTLYAVISDDKETIYVFNKEKQVVAKGTDSTFLLIIFGIVIIVLILLLAVFTKD